MTMRVGSTPQISTLTDMVLESKVRSETVEWTNRRGRGLQQHGEEMIDWR